MTYTFKILPYLILCQQFFVLKDEYLIRYINIMNQPDFFYLICFNSLTIFRNTNPL